MQCRYIIDTEEPGRLQSMGSQRVGHDWATSLSLFTFMHWRRKWQPTPVFLPGESQGRRSLVGCLSMGSHRVGRDWSDLAAVAADTEQTHHRHIQQKHNYSRHIIGAYTVGLVCADSGSRMPCMGFWSLWDHFHWGGLWWEFGKTSSFLSLSPFSFLSDTAELCFLSGGWRLILQGWALRSEGWWARLGGLGVVPEPVLSPPHPLFCHRSLLNLHFFLSESAVGFSRSAYKFLLVCF